MQRSCCTAEVALIGQPGKSRQLEWRDEVRTVGIFLTSGTRVNVLKGLVAAIRTDLPNAKVLIRQHPVALLKTDFSGIASGDDQVELTIGRPLDDEISLCDFVICGNSGVALNVLSGGRPVAYLSELDGIIFDSNGFVGSGLVYAMSDWDVAVYERLKVFYQAPGWREVMQDYDASYDSDVGLVGAESCPNPEALLSID